MLGPSTTTAGQLTVITTGNLCVGRAVVGGDQTTLQVGDVITLIPETCPANSRSNFFKHPVTPVILSMKKLITPQAKAQALPQFLNATDLVLGADPGGGYHNGQVFFANDSRFMETYFSEPLTSYAVGWRDPNNIEATVNFIAPPVTVGRRFEWKAANNAEEFLSEVTDDQRAIGADFKRVVYTMSDVASKTLNRGLTYIADLDDVVGANWQNQRVAKLLRRMWRNRLRRALTVLNASAVQVSCTWDKSTGVNPDQDVRNELINAANITGIRPNRILYGDTAYNLRNQAFGAQNSPAGYTGYMANPMDSLSAALMVDKVMVSKERYQSSSTAKSEIVGSSVFEYFAEDGVDTEDPTNLKCFVSQFSEEEGGGLVRVYVQQISAKLVAVTVEMYKLIVCTYAGGIRQLVITGPQ